MAEVLLFHHAQGLTAGCDAFAHRVRAAGHVVHAPDLYEGRTFSSLDDGVAHAQRIGFGAIIERGRRAAGELPAAIVYAGFSLGVMPAQALAQTRPGAQGAVLMHACVSPSELGGSWPPGLPLQIHTMEDDDWGDVPIARELAATIESAQLFLYPGDRHLFADDSLADYDETAASLLEQRVLAFLERLDQEPGPQASGGRASG
jgi:dienelactone hydrolase